MSLTKWILNDSKKRAIGRSWRDTVKYLQQHSSVSQLELIPFHCILSSYFSFAKNLYDCATWCWGVEVDVSELTKAIKGCCQLRGQVVYENTKLQLMMCKFIPAGNRLDMEQAVRLLCTHRGHRCIILLTWLPCEIHHLVLDPIACLLCSGIKEIVFRFGNAWFLIFGFCICCSYSLPWWYEDPDER